jgi:hypothetical protein
MHQPFTLNITAGAVAWYAAIVSTIVGIVQVLNYLRDRAKIKLIYYPYFRWTGDFTINEKIRSTLLVANTGRRPVTITRIGCTYFEIFDASFKDALPKLPCELTEGEYFLNK